jgi:C4-dicarboxylate-specific signal transduction histidine kinase
MIRPARPTLAEVPLADLSFAGLSPERPAELFKPFVTRRKDGTGLGLWISRSLVERYGGTLEADPRTDGVTGAVFTVRLPG